MLAPLCKTQYCVENTNISRYSFRCDGAEVLFECGQSSTHILTDVILKEQTHGNVALAVANLDVLSEDLFCDLDEPCVVRDQAVTHIAELVSSLVHEPVKRKIVLDNTSVSPHRVLRVDLSSHDRRLGAANLRMGAP